MNITPTLQNQNSSPPESYTRINSFTQKPSANQMIIYLASISQILTSYIIIQHRLQSHVFHIVFMTLYSVFLALKLFATVLVSYIDPSDKLMVISKMSPKTPQTQKQIIQIKQQLSNYMYCRQCNSFVKPQSKHCKKCGRCVQIFDHHCIWLNNCIGSLNYKQFIIMLYVVQIEMIVYIVGAAFLWSQQNYTIFTNAQNSPKIVNEYEYPLYQMIIVWVNVLVVSIFWLMNCYLISLHMYLIKIGLTTYEWLFGESMFKNRVGIKDASQNASKTKNIIQDEEIVRNIHYGSEELNSYYDDANNLPDLSVHKAQKQEDKHQLKNKQNNNYPKQGEETLQKKQQSNKQQNEEKYTISIDLQPTMLKVPRLSLHYEETISQQQQTPDKQDGNFGNVLNQQQKDSQAESNEGYIKHKQITNSNNNKILNPNLSKGKKNQIPTGKDNIINTIKKSVQALYHKSNNKIMPFPTNKQIEQESYLSIKKRNRDSTEKKQSLQVNRTEHNFLDAEVVNQIRKSLQYSQCDNGQKHKHAGDQVHEQNKNNYAAQEEANKLQQIKQSKPVQHTKVEERLKNQQPDKPSFVKPTNIFGKQLKVENNGKKLPNINLINKKNRLFNSSNILTNQYYSQNNQMSLQSGNNNNIPTQNQKSGAKTIGKDQKYLQRQEIYQFRDHVNINTCQQRIERIKKSRSLYSILAMANIDDISEPVVPTNSAQPQNHYSLATKWNKKQIAKKNQLPTKKNVQKNDNKFSEFKQELKEFH